MKYFAMGSLPPFHRVYVQIPLPFSDDSGQLQVPSNSRAAAVELKVKLLEYIGMNVLKDRGSFWVPEYFVMKVRKKYYYLLVGKHCF